MKLLLIDGCLACKCPHHRILVDKGNERHYLYCYLADKMIHKTGINSIPDFCPLGEPVQEGHSGKSQDHKPKG